MNELYLYATDAKEDHQHFYKPEWHELVEHDEETRSNHHKQNCWYHGDLNNPSRAGGWYLQKFIWSVLQFNIL